MKILIHIHGYPPNHNAGAEWMVHHMAKWLQSRGHKIIVAVPEPGAEEFEGIQIVPEYARIHIRNRYHWADIVISHLDRTGKVINHIRAVDKPACFIMHNTHYRNDLAQIAHRSVLCYNSEYTASVPFYKKESCIVYPPCPTEYYRTNRGGARYVTIINHWPDKGGDVFFKLAEMNPDIEFMAVRGGYGHQLKERIKNVTFKENTPNVQKQYQITKILLMPSKYESFGRVAIEAAASGIPTIAAPTPGLKESLGDAGIFCHRDDLAAWSSAIRRLLMDKDYYKEMADKAKARALELEAMIDPQMETLVGLMERTIAYKTKESRVPA